MIALVSCEAPRPAGSEVAAPAPPVAPIEIAAPAPSPAEPPRPVARQWFETDGVPAIAALPPSRQTTTRMSESRVLIEVRPHATRSDSATIVIGEGVIDDVRSPAGKLLLSRWLDAKFLAPGIGMVPPAGFVVAATTEVDTDVLTMLFALATGGNFDGPIELALRRGTEVTTIPIVLGEKGIAPMPGKWGAWARELDDAWLASAGTDPLVLALGDVVADAYQYAKRRPRLDGLTRIGKIETSGGREPSLARRIVRAYRNEIAFCYVQALVVRPSLAGTWKASAVIDADGRPGVPTFEGEADERLLPCVSRVMERWKFPRAASDMKLAFAFELTPDA